MGYGVKIYQAACKELEDRRRRAEEKAAACRERFFEDCPRAAQIREEMARNASGAARAVLSGGDGVWPCGRSTTACWRKTG